MPSAQQITLTRPDDWHLHLRDGDALQAVVEATARVFARAIVMPNLKPPVADVAAAIAYRLRILAALPAGSAFEPLMTLYLTDRTSADEIARAKASGLVVACKYYPAGATTHAEAGVTSIDGLWPVFEAMQQHDVVLCVHGEVVDADVDVFDRERVFIDRHLGRIAADFPGLRIVVEHATTRDAVQFVQAAGAGIAATITPQHLIYSRNAMLAGFMRPHLFCMPILKRDEHRQALVAAATSGDPKFFLGTDSAPHSRHAKENACGCAGCYSAPAAIELYAEVFEAAGALERLEGFASFHGADFYDLPRNAGTITLHKDAWTMPAEFAFGGETIVPLRAGESVGWRLSASS